MPRSQIVGAVTFATGALLAAGVWIRTLEREASPDAPWTSGPRWDYLVAALAFALAVAGLRLLKPAAPHLGPWGSRRR